MNNQPAPPSAPITLESIVAQKEQLRTKIHQQRQTMNQLTKDIFAPVAPAAQKSNSIMRAFNTGMAAFDGIMMGIKIMRKVRKIFR